MELVKRRHSLFCNDYKLHLLLCPPKGWITGRADTDNSLYRERKVQGQKLLGGTEA